MQKLRQRLDSRSAVEREPGDSGIQFTLDQLTSYGMDADFMFSALMILVLRRRILASRLSVGKFTPTNVAGEESTIWPPESDAVRLVAIWYVLKPPATCGYEQRLGES